MKFFFNSKNNNEYLIKEYRDKNYNFFIIIYDITNNYNIKRKLELANKKYSQNKFLLAFLPKRNENFIIVNETVYGNDDNNYNSYTKVYSFESGKFIKTFSNSYNIYIYDLLFWHNKKDNNDYIIQITNDKIFINNLYNDLYFVLNTPYSNQVLFIQK